jgi:hypothetical protein
MEQPFFDPLPKDFSEEFVLESVHLITTQVLKIQEIFEFNVSVKKILTEKVGLQNLLIEDHHYNLTRGYGRCSKIRLKAKWLDKWGFRVGNRVNIITLPDLLILTPQEVAKAVPLITKRLPKCYTL